ncbi:MAG: hypothetical protein H7833_03530 [Magnetococcus sp. DMHC-1]|nr:hypothetical protein [Magnetococcales bacterium]
MKMKLALAVLVGFMWVSSVSHAEVDHAKRIKKCIEDNQEEDASAEVIKRYCICMSGKMSDNEKKSISKWEKSHSAEVKMCDKESGWK